MRNISSDIDAGIADSISTANITCIDIITVRNIELGETIFIAIIYIKKIY